jgi:hypothetical protein
MIGATSLTLGLIYLLVWVRQPSQYGYLLFFVIAASVAALSIFELRLMRAAVPDEYAVILRKRAARLASIHSMPSELVAGRLNKQIAADLGTGEKTIEFHRGNLMRKLGVRSVADLVRLAERASVAPPGPYHH